MLRASDFLGMPVSLREGSGLGRIQDLLLDLPGARVVALVLDRTRGLIAPANIRVEDDTALIDSDDRVARGDVARRMQRGTTSFVELCRVEVIRRNGLKLGRVEDCIVQGTDVLGFEVGEGLFHDLLIGRRFVPLEGRMLFAPGKIVVEDEGDEGLAPEPWNDGAAREVHPPRV